LSEKNNEELETFKRANHLTDADKIILEKKHDSEVELALMLGLFLQDYRHRFDNSLLPKTEKKWKTKGAQTDIDSVSSRRHASLLSVMQVQN
jgi:hypothetical protein